MSSAVERVRQREPDLVVLSHLRWSWVWQRPQQLVSRLARSRSAAGARTWFVEEPQPCDEVSTARLRLEQRDDVTLVRLLVPSASTGGHLGFEAAHSADRYADLLAELLGDQTRPLAPDVWLYTPMALPLARRLRPGRILYDVMDDLSAFLHAPRALHEQHLRLLADADVVFTGGRSLHEAARARRRHHCHLFPSGVDLRHLRRAATLRRPRTRPVAGYVGVLDERLDLPLLGDLAAALPDWTIRLVGPVTKIPPESLPQAANLEYLGLMPYEVLPEVLAGFDVALMPFALNAATRSISPTKTLEYLAAGLPVVSTRVPDVVADFGAVLQLADDAEQFASACRAAAGRAGGATDPRVRQLLAEREWDTVVQRMSQLLAASPDDDASAPSALVRTTS